MSLMESYLASQKVRKLVSKKEKTKASSLELHLVSLLGEDLTGRLLVLLTDQNLVVVMGQLMGSLKEPDLVSLMESYLASQKVHKSVSKREKTKVS